MTRVTPLIALGLTAFGTSIIIDAYKEQRDEMKLINKLLDRLNGTFDNISLIVALNEYRNFKIAYVNEIGQYRKHINGINVDIKGVINKSDVKKYLAFLTVLNQNGSSHCSKLVKKRYELLREMGKEKFKDNNLVETLSQLIQKTTPSFVTYSEEFYNKLQEIIERYEQIANLNKSRQEGGTGVNAQIYQIKSDTPIPSKIDIINLLKWYQEKLKFNSYT